MTCVSNVISLRTSTKGNEFALLKHDPDLINVIKLTSAKECNLNLIQQRINARVIPVLV